MNELDNELLSNIFNFLETVDLGNVFSINQKYNSVDNDYFWKMRYITEFSYLPSSENNKEEYKFKLNPFKYLFQKYPDKEWGWRSLSKNPCLTIEFIEKHLDDVNWIWLSSNPFQK